MPLYSNKQIGTLITPGDEKVATQQDAESERWPSINRVLHACCEHLSARVRGILRLVHLVEYDVMGTIV